VAPRIFIWEAIAQGGLGSVGFRGEAPVWGLGNEVSPEAKQFADIVYIF